MATNNTIPMSQEEQSDWSLSSLQELKGLNLEDLRDQQDGNDNKQATIPVPQKSKLEPKYPPAQQITPATKLFEVGQVIQKVAELLIVEATNSTNLVDLDNWLFNENKECLGFVIDIFGRVDHPYYAVQLLHTIDKQVNSMLVFYAQGCKTLTEEDIRSIKQKSSVNKQVDQDSSSSSSQSSDNEEDFRSNVVMHRRERPPRRRASFEEQPYHQRQRTREKKTVRRFEGQQHHRRRNHDNRPYHEVNRDRQHNQAYLENMYSMYYNQMMQLYNGQNGMPLPKPPVFPFFQPGQQNQNVGTSESIPNTQNMQGSSHNPTFYYNPQQTQFPPFPQNHPK